MARKDVDLVIRARDEAAKVVDSITAAINEFVQAQDGLNKSAGKTNSTLTALGSALGNLDRDLKGLNSGERIAQEFERANAATKRLHKEFDETQQRARDLAQELKRAETILGTLAAKTDGAAAALKRAEATLAKQKAAQAALTKSLQEATVARDKLIRQQKQLDASGEKQDATVTRITERYNRLTAQLAATSSPTRKLKKELEDVTISLAKQTAKLDEMAGRYQATFGQIDKAEASVGELAAKLAQSTAQIERQSAVVGKIGANYRALSQDAKAAANHQKGIADAAEKTGDALDRAAGRINQAEQELAQLAVAAGKSDAALTELAGRSGAALEAAFAEARQALRQTRAEFLEASKGAKELAAAIDIIGPPTREQVVALGRLNAATNQAEASYLVQSAGLQRLRGIMEQSSGTISELIAKNHAFAAVQAETSAALNKIQSEAKQTAAAYDQMAVVTGQSAANVRRTGQALREAGDAAGGASGKVRTLGQAFRSLYGETRLAMSWTQRLRGEVLSLISAYGGIFGVIQLLDRTVKAYQTLEAAQGRLNVAFEGNKANVGKELDFVRRNADRLGIEFGALADEYSKFAIATKGTNLEGEKTRRIFISVAEAARVARLSNENLQGVFTALSQIVSKGKVQMEELRQQLGDRLPGAVQLMADALNVGTDELFKMIEAGEVGAEALVPFAEELDKRFGPGLAEALSGTTTALGEFKNAAFQALLAFGRAGFLESFTGLLKDLSATLKSADFRAFAANASQAFAVLVKALALAAKNFDLLVIAASAFLGIRLAPILIAAGAGMLTFATRLQRANMILGATRNAMVAATAGTTGLTAAAAASGTAMRGLGLAARAVFSTTGWGAIITLVATGIGVWATRADEASEAMERHQAIVDKVRNAYDKATGEVKNWADELKEVTKLQAEANFDDLEKAAKKVRASLFEGLSTSTGVAQLRGEAKHQAEELRNLAKEYQRTGGNVDEFKKKVQAIADAALDESIKAYALAILNAADSFKPLNEAVQEAADVIKAKSKNAEEAEAAIKRLMGVTEDDADANKKAAESGKDYNSALEKIRDTAKEAADKLEDLKESADLEEAFQSALRAASNIQEIENAIDGVVGARKRLADANIDNLMDDGGTDDLVDIIAGIESGGNRLAKNPKSTATGLGQFIESTWLRMFKQYFPDRAAGLSNAMILEMRKDADLSRQMIRLYTRENAKILQDAGVATNKASLYLAHFLGPQGAIGVMKRVASGRGGESVENFIGKQAIAANPFLEGMTASQLLAWAGKKVGLTKEELEIRKHLSEEDRKAAEEAAKDHERTQERIAGNNQEIEQQRLINEGKAREAEVAKAIAEAKKENPNITAQEIEQIRQQTEALFNLKAVKDQDKASQKEAEALMARINALMAQRVTLEQSLKAAQKSGDTVAVQTAEQAIANVNTQLEEAIAKARAMWEAIGGAASETALIKLDTAALKIQKFQQSAKETFIDWNRVGQLFASGLTNAFDRFFQLIAEGESVGEAARQAFLQFAADFLRQIAQMIIQQAILNALRSFAPSLFGGLGGAGVAHTGGVAGQRTAGRVVPAALFAAAQRAHSGGVPGLRPGEIPMILKQREEVLTEDDPRHIFNGGGAGGGGGSVDMKIVNAIDAVDFLEQALVQPRGQKVFLNYVSSNPAAFRNALAQ